MIMADDNKITTTDDDHETLKSSLAVQPLDNYGQSLSKEHHQESLSSNDDTEVFDRIANKLLRSGLLLTALELHAELIERGKECSRLREFFDNPHNFEKHFDHHQLNSPLMASTSSSAINPTTSTNQKSHCQIPSTSFSSSNNPTNIQPTTLQQMSNNLSMERTCPSEKNSLDSFDFTHYSDDDDLMAGGGERSHGDQRIAVLEFELRKAQQTIKSLRASLTMSTVQGGTGPDSFDADHQFADVSDVAIQNSDFIQDSGTHFGDKKNTHQRADHSSSLSNAIISSSSANMDYHQQQNSYMSRHDLFGRGSADGDSCPGEDDNKFTNVRLGSSLTEFDLQPTSSQEAKYSIGALIKPHERRALNYLINEYLMANNYKLTSITFCDENTDPQDFDNWDDVGLNVQRPPDLLKLYRAFWKNRAAMVVIAGSSSSYSGNTSAIQPTGTSGAILTRTNSNVTAITNRTITGNFEDELRL